MIAVFLGAPGSGKGTQAKKLCAKLGVPQLSTGDMLRSAIAGRSELGLRAKGFIDEGKLVPDSLVIDLIRDRISLSDCQNGFILDGFPRTLPQGEALEELLASQGRALSKVVLFGISEQVLVDRLTGRRTCSHCGAMFHVKFQPPKVEGICDSCSAALIQRSDDTLDVIQKRMSVFREQTSPLEGFYRSRGALAVIDAAVSPELVYSQLSQLLS